MNVWRITDWLGYQRHRLLREHDLCEPGCWETAVDDDGKPTWFPHCWKCGARMKYESPTERFGPGVLCPLCDRRFWSTGPELICHDCQLELETTDARVSKQGGKK